MLACLLVVGVVLVASASQGQNLELAQRQSVWVAAGLALAVVIGLLDYRNLTDNAYLIWGFLVSYCW